MGVFRMIESETGETLERKFKVRSAVVGRTVEDVRYIKSEYTLHCKVCRRFLGSIISFRGFSRLLLKCGNESCRANNVIEVEPNGN